MSTLAIISHTEHYITSDGQILGLSSTVSEINHLLEIFDHIYHLGMLHDKEPPPNTLAYASDNITFIPLPALGGSRFLDKLGVITKAPMVINEVRKVLRLVDHFQFRAPTGIGVYVIPYLMLFQSKSGWYKYAGNWKQEHAPLAYKIQRWLLQRQKRIVTINGNWNDQPKHCISFENPCLTTSELQEGARVIQNKALDDGKFHLCFVGRLEEAKGIGNLLTA
ncbi:MAG: capsular biosynthesis protein, partial [Psychroserpens sp.]|nr:capsular biosynthesis protein [Psychroserpens sp.]